ncbi:MAG: glycosyltransferase involved in cell wall biosynthesis [Flavobacteriales bacterium]|jgi:glycosyltransferase involved in cell wall biosynthesis
MKHNKNIIWISHGSTLHGAERVLIEGVKGLKNLNYEVNVVFPSNGELLEKCNQYVVNISITNIPWWIDRGVRINFISKVTLLLEIFKSTFNILKEIRRLKGDTVISNTIAIPSGAIAAFILRKKHIWYIHEFGKEDHNFNFIFNEWLSCKVISLLSNKVIFNSIAVKNKFDKYISSKKTAILYSAVDINSFDKKIYTNLIFNKNQPLKIAIIGRVSKSKGQFEAIKAIEYLILKKKYNIDLKIIGALNDEYTLKLSKYVLDNKMEKQIEIISFISNPIDFMKRSDVCLNCSKQEAFGLITVESMKLGIPVIASDTGGNLELVENNKNGMLYRQGNYRSLAEKIEYLYLNPNEIERMGSYAYEWSNKKFNLIKYQDELDKVIMDVYKKNYDAK